MLINIYKIRFNLFSFFLLLFILCACQGLGGDDRIELFQFLEYTGEKFWASDELAGGKGEEVISGIFGTYGPQNLFDHDTSTYWAAGDGNLAGQEGKEDITIDVIFPETMTSLGIWNGAQRDSLSYVTSGRVKEIDLMVYLGLSHPSIFAGSEIARYYEGYLFGTRHLVLDDRMGQQDIPFWFSREELNRMIPISMRSFQGRYGEKLARAGSTVSEASPVFILRIRVRGSFPGEKQGFPCLSEISLR